MSGLRAAALYLLGAAFTAANAHEFWIEPTRFEVATSNPIVADLRVGQYFKGNSQVLEPYKFVSFDVIDPGGSRPVTGRLGDLPAVDVPTDRAGLHVLAYRSTTTSTTYTDLAKFESFAHKHGVDWVIDAHRRRDLPKTGIKEAYTRYAKTLVRVGDGAGRDQTVGFPLELVAETNPYTDGTNGDIAVRLLWQDQLYANAQISIFQRFIGCEANKTTMRTNAEGRAKIPRGPGGRFLISAVHMMEPSGETLDRIRDVHWESLWASLTFELPETNPGDETANCEPRDTSHQEKR